MNWLPAVGLLVVWGISSVSAPRAFAQIEITEIMYDSADTPSEFPWEWVEIRNAGSSSVDLHDWVFCDRASRFNFPNLSNTLGDTVVPAGGVAVIYNSPQLGNDPSRFTGAWGSGIQLIPVNSFGAGLNNGANGDRFGLWSSYASYNPGGGTPTAEPVWANAVFELDYASGAEIEGVPNPNPYPGVGSGGKSIAWKGAGDIHLGSSWVASAADDAYGAHASSVTNIAGALVNSTDDAGTPGLLLQGGTPPANQLIITEIMYNPRSSDDQFEWVEFLNNTGATIDFGATHYVFDDFASAVKSDYNVQSGVVPNGGIGVFVDIDGLTSLGVTIADLEDAWEDNVGAEINFIPVTGWQDLNNNDDTTLPVTGPADTIGLWDDLTEYATDYAAGRTNWTLAKAQVTYSDEPMDGWEEDDGDGSIYLNDLGADGTLGSHWTLTGGPNDSLGAINPEGIFQDIQDHDGNDVGSPGTVPSAPEGLLGDYSGNNVVDAADYTVWRDKLNGGGPLPNDPTPGTIDATDYDYWKSHFGATPPGSGGLAEPGAVPEPASLALVLVGLVGVLVGRRWGR